MNRKLTLTLTLAVALASQLALGGCNKKQDVTPTTDIPASGPDAAASSSMMGASAVPLDGSASAAAMAASGAASQ